MPSCCGGAKLLNVLASKPIIFKQNNCNNGYHQFSEPLEYTQQLSQGVL